MLNYYLIFLYGLLFYLLNLFFIKKKFLLDKIHSSSHKIYLTQNQTPLSGGILFLTLFIFFLSYFNTTEKILMSSIFFVGIFSYMNKLKSPPLRLLLQFLTIFLIINVSETYVYGTRLDFLDSLINKYFFIKLFFTIFCILVFINGSNFIDGINTLAGGYFASVLLIFIIVLTNADLPELLNVITDLKIMLLFLAVFLTYNLFSKSFLGDGGSYFISLVIGIYCIKISSILANNISPFFVALILWYPAFENLFSILRRRFYQGKEVKYADNLHLHHLLFAKLNQKIDKRFSNSLTGILINIFIIIFFFIGLMFINNSIVLIFLIICKSIIYLGVYLFFLKNK